MLASSVLCWADDVRVSSPDGNLVVTVNIKNGVPSYSATLFNKTVIEHSALGLKTSVGNFTQGLQLLNHVTTAIHEKYQMRGTKASSNDYQANRVAIEENFPRGQLNPEWVEWLMGFPIGWTELSASATP